MFDFIAVKCVYNVNECRVDIMIESIVVGGLTRLQSSSPNYSSLLGTKPFSSMHTYNEMVEHEFEYLLSHFRYAFNLMLSTAHKTLESISIGN